MAHIFMNSRQPLRVAIAGYGSIGQLVAAHLDQGIPGLRLVAVAGRDLGKTRTQVAALQTRVEALDLSQLSEIGDVIVDCAPPHEFRNVVLGPIERARTIVTVSATSLIENEDLVDKARESGARIILVSGSLIGFDGIRAAACGKIHHASLTTRKPPLSLLNNPWVLEQGIDVRAIRTATKIFSGSARAAAQAFPDKFNVAATLALASLGPDHVEVDIWLDPDVERNVHQIRVDADSTSFEAEIRNLPNPGHRGTGPFTAYHVIAALRDLTSPFRIGT